MINEQAKGELRFLLILFACMTGLLVLLGIAGMIEVDTGERMTSPACAAPGGDECEIYENGSDNCPLECQKCEMNQKGNMICQNNCPEPNDYCTLDGCVNCPPPKPNKCTTCEDGVWEEDFDRSECDCEPENKPDIFEECLECEDGEWEVDLFCCRTHCQQNSDNCYRQIEPSMEDCAKLAYPANKACFEAIAEQRQSCEEARHKCFENCDDFK